MKNLKMNAVLKNKEKVLNAMLAIEEKFNQLPELNLHQFNKEETAIVFVDVINGFVSEGNLKSDRADAIFKPLVKLDKKTKNYLKVFFIDSHDENSVEFEAYPPHCIKGTSETQLALDFDVNNPRSIAIEKNSVNGFFAPYFASWLKENPNVKNFIIVGLVTDICVMNFALSLKAYFNQWNQKSRIVVPITCVETFDLEVTNHEASMMNLFALYNMQMNGIELYNY